MVRYRTFQVRFYYVLDAEEYEAERVLIRRYTVKLSVIRGLIKEAKRRKELGITTTIKEEMAQEAAANPVVVLDGSLQADILNDLCGVQDRLGKVQQALRLGCGWAVAPRSGKLYRARSRLYRSQH